jgi:hypothetical protein
LIRSDFGGIIKTSTPILSNANLGENVRRPNATFGTATSERRFSRDENRRFPSPRPFEKAINDVEKKARAEAGVVFCRRSFF